MRIPVEALRLFTEAQCSASFDTPIVGVRRQKSRAGIALESPLSYNGMKELKHTCLDKSIQETAELYQCSKAEVLKARYHLSKSRPNTRPTVDELKPWLLAGLSEAEIAEEFGCTARHVSKIKQQLPEYQELFGSQRLSKTEVEHVRIALAKKLATQQELAIVYNISQSRVSQLNPNKQKRALYGKLTDAVWAKIKPLIGKKQIAELARDFNLSRGAIYGRLKKEKRDVDN